MRLVLISRRLAIALLLPTVGETTLAATNKLTIDGIRVQGTQVQVTVTYPVAASGTVWNIYSLDTNKALTQATSRWQIADTNVALTGATATVWIDVGQGGRQPVPLFSNRFYIAINPAYDQDADGLSDGQEHFIEKTDRTLADTDGDGILDRDELNIGLDPLVAETNCILGTIYASAGGQPIGAAIFELAFSPTALRIIGVGSSGQLKPHEYSVGQTTNYLSGASDIAYYQAHSRASPTSDTALVAVLFRKIGTSGQATGVSVTSRQCKHADTGAVLSSPSVYVSGVPSTLP